MVSCVSQLVEGVVCHPFSHGEVVLVPFEEGMGEHDDTLRELLEVQLQPEVDGENALTPPLDRWFSESKDTELVEELEAVSSEQGMLGALIATGALARHEQTFHSFDERQSFLENLRLGILPDEDPQRRWARTLTSEQARVLREFTCLQASLLEDELAIMNRRAADALRTTWWKSICEQRDDLESLRALVAVCDGGEDAETSATIAALDEQAVSILNAEHGPGEFTPSVRLERATIQDPMAWWVARVLI
jgi:hypothetical protein